ncbi:LuxR family transcriptional regulator [Conexibacter woesei]|uniref:LuxR family transcriptional regulator n=1 Tax=Conexibacter woesei TaxID=191495 RepID=UPI00040CBA82|nr:LuxR family transcriptional regulator [Conexibacter woesei]
MIEGPTISLHRAPLARPALVARLDDTVLAGGVAILAAEPGTGKSELLAQWRAQIASALDVTVVDGALPRTWAPGLRAARDHPSGRPAALVVDHADRLPPAYLALLGDALAHRGDGLGAVLAGRRDPGLCLIELRATGVVDELDGTDLAWCAGDVADAFARWGRPLPDGAAADLAWRTDGWAAALRLAALVGPQVLDADGGALADYVLGPALRGVPDDVVAAALRLALAEEVDEPVAELLVHAPGGAGALLASLRTRRLFVRCAEDPDAAARGALRFTRLFAHVARRELAAREPTLTADLRRRLQRHLGDAASGISGAPVPAGPPGAIADAALGDELLAAHAVELLLAGVLDRPTPAALAALPRASAAGRAAAALGLLAAGDLAAADAVLAIDAGAGAGAGTAASAPPGDVLAIVALLRHRHRGDRDALAAAVDALPAGRGGDDGVRALAYVELGLLEHDLGDLPAAEEHLQLAIALGRGAGRAALAARAGAGLALLNASAGRLRESVRLADAALGSGETIPAAARARAALARAQVAVLRDEMVDARAWAERARAAVAATDDLPLWLDVLFWEIATLEALGAHDDAGARLAQARDIRRRAPYPGLYGELLDVYRARLLEREGRDAEARRVLESLDPTASPVVAIIAAGRYLRAGDPHGALGTAAPWLAEDADPARTGGALRVWLLLHQAVALHQIGDAETAHASLEAALDTAVPEGVRRPFSDTAPRLVALLSDHRSSGTAHAGFVAELLDRTTASRPGPDAELAAPLTDRERVVLGFLPSAMTAADIADALIVSEATVRTHLRHIYGKLGAKGRREALACARDLRLLAPEDS